MVVLVSIIIPHYNRFELLHDFLLQIPVRDIRDDVEIIIIDDASNRMTGKNRVLEKICDLKKQGLSIVFIESHVNMGAPTRRNDGIELAHGEYIHFLDSDDLVIWEHYLTQIRMSKMAAGEFDVIVARKLNIHLYRLGLYDATLVSFNWIGPLSGVIFKRDSLESLQFDINLVAMQDWDFYVRYFAKGNRSIYFASEEFFHYQVTQDSITLDPEKFCASRHFYYDKHLLEASSVAKSLYFWSIFFFCIKRSMLNLLPKVLKQMKYFSSLATLISLPFGLLQYLILKLSVHK